MRDQTNHGRHRVGLILTLVGLIGAATLVLGPARLASAQAVAPSWSFTGNLNTAPFGHTATLLPNGKVLVAGGFLDVTFCPCVTDAAELYNPATGTWTNTSNLVTSRGDHTATLLSDGSVLVAGGNDGSGSLLTLKTAELYDPATDSWSSAGNLNTARSGHTATLMPNGKVLVAGGERNGNGPLNSAELYDPATGTWSSTGNLNISRARHTATLLPGGKVLVAGGFVNPATGQVTNSAELYDPATGTWSTTGNLNTGRAHHTATLLAGSGGKVLVAGGFSCAPPSQTCSALNSAELYDPATGTWSSTGNLNSGRADGHTATLLLSGKVLVAAGAFDNSELYDPATGTWSNTATLNAARRFHTATLLLNGKVLVAGGSGDNTAELYDPGTNSIPNQIDEAQFFVRQHYLDFLNRDPDADGLAFWINEITECGTDAGCIEAKRINVSGAFFVSIEFQETGYLVYRVYKSSYGNMPGAPVPITLSEFLPDTQEIGHGVIVNEAGWEQVLENNKQALIAEFVQRSRFTSAYATSMTPTDFVDQLFMNAGVTPSATDRAAAINEFGSASATADMAARARALRRVAENSTLAQQEFNRAFVLMQYFGYLRRNPPDPPEPTLDFQGYNFWLSKLDQFHGNFINAEMVKAFIVSTEYRQRFGQP
jgi:N-acetylneuraminic acid mutarotase